MNECIFCKIVAGEAPAEFVLENDEFVAIRDANPKAPVHVLVIPREHVESLEDVPQWPEARSHELLSFAVRVADATGIRQSGYRVLTNVGPDSGQVVHHLHFHVLGGAGLGDFA